MKWNSEQIDERMCVESVTNSSKAGYFFLSHFVGNVWVNCVGKCSLVTTGRKKEWALTVANVFTTFYLNEFEEWTPVTRSASQCCSMIVGWNETIGSSSNVLYQSMTQFLIKNARHMVMKSAAADVQLREVKRMSLVWFARGSAEVRSWGVDKCISALYFFCPTLFSRFFR